MLPFKIATPSTARPGRLLLTLAMKLMHDSGFVAFLSPAPDTRSPHHARAPPLLQCSMCCFAVFPRDGTQYVLMILAPKVAKSMVMASSMPAVPPTMRAVLPVKGPGRRQRRWHKTPQAPTRRTVKQRHVLVSWFCGGIGRDSASLFVRSEGPWLSSQTIYSGWPKK